MVVRFTFYSDSRTIDSNVNGQIWSFSQERVKQVRKKIAISIIILIAIWVVYSISQPAVLNSLTTYTQVGGNTTAPDFSLRVVSGNDLTGQTMTLSSFRGKIILLEFIDPSS